MEFISYDRSYRADEDGFIYSACNVVKTFKLVERGHLHVLKYLHEELNHYLGLQRYCKPAIQHGQLDILKWLYSIGCMDGNILKTNSEFCNYAVKIGNLEVLQWLLRNGFWIKDSEDILPDAINSKSFEMIQYCFNCGYDDLQNHDVEKAIKNSKSVEIYRLMYELGYQFEGIRKWCCAYDMAEHFETIKFLRSISIPWDREIMLDFVEYGTLEMVQYAHEDGCPWSTNGGEYDVILWTNRWSFEKLDYLIKHGCRLEYSKLTFRIKNSLIEKRNIKLLDYFVGKDSSFDNDLFKRILNRSDREPWVEGVSYLLEKGRDVQNVMSIEEAFHQLHKIEGIKYLHSLGLPWCLDSSRNTHLLSKIACYNKLDDVKWAYENGCNGGHLVPFAKEEWKEKGIRYRDEWKANQAFFEENELLSQKMLAPTIFQVVGDVLLDSEVAFFNFDFTSLKSLVDLGYTFRSEGEKVAFTQVAFKVCCQHHRNHETHRKRFAIVQQIGVREL